MGSAQVRLEAASIRRTPLSAYHTVLLETFSFGFSKGNPVDSWGYSGCCMAALPVCLRGSQPEKNGLGRRTDWGSLLLGGCFFWKCPKTMVFRLRGPVTWMWHHRGRHPVVSPRAVLNTRSFHAFFVSLGCRGVICLACETDIIIFPGLASVSPSSAKVTRRSSFVFTGLALLRASGERLEISAFRLGLPPPWYFLPSAADGKGGRVERGSPA